MRETVFSPCRKYRYVLWREWGNIDPVRDLLCSTERGRDGREHLGTREQFVMFIGLNPSTADETKDDPTIRRCIQYAKDWGFGALCMTNLFAWRETDPVKMKQVDFPRGELNDHYLEMLSQKAAMVVAAWGNDGAFCGRGSAVRRLIPNLHVLKINEKTGQPSHLLYLSAKLRPVPWKA